MAVDKIVDVEAEARRGFELRLSAAVVAVETAKKALRTAVQNERKLRIEHAALLAADPRQMTI